MVTYNPKDWLRLIVHFHKSDTFRILLPAIFLLGIITAAVSYVEQHYLRDMIPANLTIFHQISGFILSLVLVFRINSAYDRWWEGRKLWGSLLNTSRNLAIKLNSLLAASESETRRNLSSLISNYAIALKEHLRGNDGRKLLVSAATLSNSDLEKTSHVPNAVACALSDALVRRFRDAAGQSNDLLLLNRHLEDLTDICGACERIRNTPIPYSYSIFIKKIVFIYVITMPVSFGLTAGYWSVPIVMIMFYAFASLELISEEIEDPFGSDANDLPTDEIAARIQANVSSILLS